MVGQEFFTPAQAVEKIKELHGKTINVNRLRQLSRKGKIHATRLGYNTTVYTLEDLQNADLSLDKVGRKKKSE